MISIEYIDYDVGIINVNIQKGDFISIMFSLQPQYIPEMVNKHLEGSRFF